MPNFLLSMSNVKFTVLNVNFLIKTTLTNKKTILKSAQFLISDSIKMLNFSFFTYQIEENCNFFNKLMIYSK